MKNTPPSLAKLNNELIVAELKKFAEGWLLDCEISQHSQRTIDSRKDILRKFTWFLESRSMDRCGRFEVRQFLAYCTNGHKSAGGRWGNPRMISPVRPRTVQTYHGHLKTFFGWLVKEELLDSSPMATIDPPEANADQVQPFTEDQIHSLLLAARKGNHRLRDEAIVNLLFDTGIRASELCNLTRSDIDLDSRHVNVLGKGNKRRSIPIGGTTMKSIWNYLKHEQHESDTPLFLSDRGTNRDDGFTRSGLLQLIHRLGSSAGLASVRVSPHTFRHTFAITFLRNGGNVFSLQQMLGHTGLQMTQRYVAIAQADLDRQHRAFSPVDRLKQKDRRK